MSNVDQGQGQGQGQLRLRLTLAVAAGIASGAARAVFAWLLEQIDWHL